MFDKNVSELRFAQPVECVKHSITFRENDKAQQNNITDDARTILRRHNIDRKRRNGHILLNYAIRRRWKCVSPSGSSEQTVFCGFTAIRSTRDFKTEIVNGTRDAQMFLFYWHGNMLMYISYTLCHIFPKAHHAKLWKNTTRCFLKGNFTRRFRHNN